MIRKRVDILIGLFFCVILEKHAIAAILGKDASFTTIISVTALCFLAVLYVLNYNFSQLSKVNFKKLIPIVLIFFSFLYGMISTIVNHMYRFDLLVELSVMGGLFLIAKSISITSFNSILIFSYIMSSSLAVFLIFDRGYVFSGDINYLLISLPLGLTSILAFAHSCIIKEMGRKLFYFLCFSLCFFSLFYLQSRAVFLTTIAYVLFVYIYCTMKYKKYFTFTFVLVVFMLFLSLYSDFFYEFYSESVLHNRLDLFLSGNSNEPRRELYKNYFFNLNNFYISGFGVGGTEAGLFSSSVEKYPHNLILEFWSEFGIIGLIFAIYFITVSLFKCFCLIFIDKAGLLVVLFFMFFLMNFMKSFSIYQASILFISTGFLFNEKIVEIIKSRSGYCV